MNNNFGNNRLNFLIKKKDGIKYSKTSKDNNKIHINEKYGYNSIFGECIVHGTHLISKFLKKYKMTKHNFKKRSKEYLHQSQLCGCLLNLHQESNTLS